MLDLSGMQMSHGVFWTLWLVGGRTQRFAVLVVVAVAAAPSWPSSRLRVPLSLKSGARCHGHVMLRGVRAD
jgi:hypothetical protein